MKTATLVLVLVMVAPPVFAQNHSLTVQVDVGNDDDLSRKIMDRVTTQIGQELARRMGKQCGQRPCDAGGLYTPQSRTERSDVLITITCMHDFCASVLEYWPIRELGLHTALASCIAEGSETELTQKIFDHFVQNTSDEQLTFASGRFKTLLNRAISMFPKGVK